MAQLNLFGEASNRAEVAALEARRHAQPDPGRPSETQAATDKAAILAELRRGPATAVRLQEICLGYRQRISDLRKGGHRIECRKLSGRVSLYELHVGGRNDANT